MNNNFLFFEASTNRIFTKKHNTNKGGNPCIKIICLINICKSMTRCTRGTIKKKIMVNGANKITKSMLDSNIENRYQMMHELGLLANSKANIEMSNSKIF